MQSRAVEGFGRHLEKPDASGFSCISAATSAAVPSYASAMSPIVSFSLTIPSSNRGISGATGPVCPELPVASLTFC